MLDMAMERIEKYVCGNQSGHWLLSVFYCQGFSQHVV